jgi:NitT/TauT family transport system ATP-binding protein
MVRALSVARESAGESLATFEGVKKAFPVASGSLTAVEGVNLDIKRGEIITILGPSGCGKSTLLNMLAGVFAPSEGRVTYQGIAVTGLNRNTGYMTQNDHLLPWRTVAANVRAPLELKGWTKTDADRRVEELIGTVGLVGFASSYPSQISGGMRKRTALARLFAQDPETFLLDEPFVALDAQLRLAMQSELRSLSRQFSKTVLFVTHDVDEAASLGDRCIIFSKRPGRIRTIVDIDLPADRSLFHLRQDPHYSRISAHLWDFMAKEAGLGEAQHRVEP